MKKYFVAYRHTGEFTEVLEERIGVVMSGLGKAGIDAYCNLYDQAEYERDNLTEREIMQKAFAKIDGSDGLLALIASNSRSEGQLMEIGYAIAKQKEVVTAIHTGVVSYVDALADQAIRWSDLSDLHTKLKGLQT